MVTSIMCILLMIRVNTLDPLFKKESFKYFSNWLNWSNEKLSVYKLTGEVNFNVSLMLFHNLEFDIDFLVPTLMNKMGLLKENIGIL